MELGVDREYTPRVQPEHDIDRLILELNATQPPEPVQVTPGSTTRLDRWLQLVADKGGSDLLLVAGAPPSVRVKGTLVPLAEGPLDGIDIEEAVLPAIPPHARRQYRDSRIADASYRLPGLARFRINLHRERGRAAAAVRMLPAKVPRLASLDLPPQVELLAQLPRGLVLIGGPTGSGKSTTLAALVEEINRRGGQAYRHHRRPDRVRAHARRQPDRAGGDRRRRSGFSDGASRRAAAGAGCDSRRRNA